MSIKTRIWLLLALLGVVAVAIFEILVRSDTEEEARIQREADVQLTKLVVRMVRLTNNQLYQFSRSYRKWDDLVGFVQDPSPAWPEKNVDQLVERLHVERMWILRADASVVHEATWPEGRAGPDVLPPADELLPLLRQKRYAYFSLRLPSGLYRVQAMPIVPLKASRTLSPPEGWLLFAKQWDEVYLRHLGDLCEGRAVIAWPGGPETSDGKVNANVQTRWPLKDAQGRILAHLVVSRLDKGLLGRKTHEKQELGIFIAQTVVSMVLLGIFLRQWVLMPFAQISQSLATLSLDPIRPLLKQKTEFGHMARLVRSSFADHAALRRSLAEHAQLQRDLHDSVIQSVYAAGMTLVSAQSLLTRDPAEAERFLAETRARLNGVIRDLRFCLGEAGPDQEQGPAAFGPAVAAVVERLQSLPPARLELVVDEQLSHEMSLDQRNQLLQIVRESVSNAIRHGQPGQLRVSLSRERNDVRLEVCDNGSGFDRAAPRVAGRGLVNLAERAGILGGCLDVCSSPGQGTSVRVTFPHSVEP